MNHYYFTGSEEKAARDWIAHRYYSTRNNTHYCCECGHPCKTREEWDQHRASAAPHPDDLIPRLISRLDELNGW